MKHRLKDKFRTISKLAGVLLLCSLQYYWVLDGMPVILQGLLWTIYATQILIISCELFDIKIKTVIDILCMIPDLLSGNRPKK